MRFARPCLIFIVQAACATLLVACGQKENSAAKLEEIAANEEVLAFMKAFDGRGALSDSTEPSSPEKSLVAFRHPDDIKVELVLSEPEITQPVFMTFDHRGRLWVVQYNQYPYPRDLKVTAMDQHIRATFDKIPPPPGQGISGADKVTFFEDPDGDGTFDRQTDAISGLNIATSVALGRGKIWVLNPPYLLAYPDADDNGLPDGPPVVHLKGFGLEDTHAVANNLRWGPDGWLYGAQGSTCTANISSDVSKNVRFDGQAIWRYHPETKVFEVFAEGGGNTFDIEIDEKGRFYSGDNGTSRGQYYKQGAFYVRNFGKHGALTNPYAFGFLSNMELNGEKVRFTHAFVKYEGGHLPASYDGCMIAINPLQSYVQLSRFEENGSTFRVVDLKRIIETDDHWFRPVDITTGPDGGVYIVDWYDSRLSHVDPRDTWSKSNGRIYRLRNTREGDNHIEIDMIKLTGNELAGLLSHKNRWFRQQALRVLADRRDTSVIPLLKKLFDNGTAQEQLEALWAMNLLDGLNEELTIAALRKEDPFVRLWAVRLMGERKEVSDLIALELERLAFDEPHSEVRSQLAATAKRLSGNVAIPVVKNLLKGHNDSADPDIPLQIWWALESKIDSHNSNVLELFSERAFWQLETVRTWMLERLMQRYTMAGDSASFASCATLIKLAPSLAEVKILVNGMQEGLRGQDMVHMPAVLVAALAPYKKQLSAHSMAFALRQGREDAATEALTAIQNKATPLAERLSYIRIFGEIDEPRCVPVLLGLIENNLSSAAIRQSALQSLQRYSHKEIGARVAKAYPDKLRADAGVRAVALSLFATRPEWALELLNAIDRKKLPDEDFIAHTINKDDVPQQIVRQLKLLGDDRVTDMATRIWPDVRMATTAERTQRISQVASILEKGTGRPVPGKKIYMNSCGTCHRLFNEGGTLGPDLTGYDRKNTNELITNIVDPGAYVREGYVTYRITTSDGRVLSGNVGAKEGTSIHVNLLSGESITLPEAEITEMAAQPSMMPDHLLDDLSDDEIRDLFSYLSQQSPVN